MDGRQEAREQDSGMTPECLCAWGQDKGWQVSDSASALCSRVARPELHSITQPLTISLIFLPRTWPPFSEAGQEAARGCLTLAPTPRQELRSKQPAKA